MLRRAVSKARPALQAWWYSLWYRPHALKEFSVIARLNHAAVFKYQNSVGLPRRRQTMRVINVVHCLQQGAPMRFYSAAIPVQLSGVKAWGAAENADTGFI